MTLLRSLPLGLAVSLCAAVGHAHGDDKPFGPWDAGELRPVARGGKDAKARPPHPHVGDAAKVPASGPPPPPLRTDPDLPEWALDRGNRVGSSLSANPLYLAALVYSGFLTKIDGPRCRHYPTCSRFANQAVARHGVIGIFLGLERVITDESSSAVRRLPEVDMPGEDQPRYFDPVDNYEFWIPGKIEAFPAAAAEEPLSLSPLHELSDDDATQAVHTKGLPKCSNGHTLRPPEAGVVEEACGPERS